jgi:hypothetical protein
MSRKRLDAEGVAQVRELLLSGKTASETAELVGMSAATINNLKAQFKKQGDVFPNNRGRRPGAVSNLAAEPKIYNANAAGDYIYKVNGIKITFSDRPKLLRIGKKGLAVEF